MALTGAVRSPDASDLTYPIKVPTIVAQFTVAPALNTGATWSTTLPTTFASLAQQRADQIMLRQKAFGIWQPMTWSQALARVRAIAVGIAAHGLKVGDSAAILANTSSDWLLTDLAIQCAGGVSVGIYPTDAPEQVEYALDNSDATVVFVEDEEQLDKVLLVRARLPHLARIIVFDMTGLHKLVDDQVNSLAVTIENGIAQHSTDASIWPNRLGSRSADDLAVLIYTSGTTGRPKGAMLSHGSMMALMRATAATITQSERDERLCYLPLCHIAEKSATAYVSILTGTILNFVESPDTVLDNLREVQPTVFLGVPRIWEKLYSSVRLRMAEATRFEQWAYRLAIAVGARAAELEASGQPMPIALRTGVRVARWLVLDNVRRFLGLHRGRLLFTGAAPIAPDLIRWAHALGLPLFELYGSTEGGLVSSNQPHAAKIGTVGRPVPGVTIAIADDGEILVRAASLAIGYFNLPQRTTETWANDWLHTGDVGELDAEGYLRITDRKKDVLITAGGKNVAPSEIENELKFSPFISDAIVIGDRRKYLTCLVMIDLENVEQFAQQRAVPFSNFSSLCHAAAVRDLIEIEINKVNAKLARVEQVKKFRIIDRQLTPEDEELTPTMKLKRKLVNEKYKSLIDAMYEET